MKLAIAADKDDMDGPVAERFENAALFFLVDTESGEIQKMNNRLADDDQDPGLHAAQAVTREGVRGAVAGQFDAHSKKALDFAGVKTYTARERTVSQAAEDYKKGTLSRFAE